MRLFVATALAFAVAACGTMRNTACPALIEYDAGFNRHLADELSDLPADSAVLRAVRDYISLRDQIRACNTSVY